MSVEIAHGGYEIATRRTLIALVDKGENLLNAMQFETFAEEFKRAVKKQLATDEAVKEFLKSLTYSM